MYKAIRRESALEIVSYAAVIVAAIAYAINLMQGHAHVQNDVRLIGYFQVAAADTRSRDHALTDYENIVLDSSSQGASATWALRAPQSTSALSPDIERSAYIFVVSPLLTFTRADGTATVALVGRNDSVTTIGTLNAIGRNFEPGQSMSIVSIPPVADSGFTFALPHLPSCRPNCTLRLAIAHGKWDIQRVGLAVESDSRIGPPLWNENLTTLALVIAFVTAVSAGSSGCLFYFWRSRTGF